MDYETKIILQQLIDAINHSNDKMATVAIVSAVASGILSIVLLIFTMLLGKRQNQIQKNNIKSQLFDRQYKVYEAIIEAKVFLNREDHFMNGFYIDNYFDNLGRIFLEKIEKLNDAQLSAEALFSHEIHEKVKNITILFAKARTKFFEFNKVGYNYMNKLTEDQLNHIREIVFLNALDLKTIREEIEKIVPHLFDKLPEWQKLVNDFNNYISECQIMTDFDSYLKINNIDK